MNTNTQATAATITVSDNEMTLLQAIRDAARKMKVNPVDVAIPCVNPFENKYVGSGTFASAMRKGLIGSQDYGTKEHAVFLTELGLQVTKRRAK